MPHILALDPATKCGWARHEPGMNRPVSGVERSEGLEFGARAGHFRDWLLRKIDGVGVDVIAVEQPFWAQGGATNAATQEWQLWQFGCIREVAFARRLPVRLIPIHSWRKHFVGYGRAPRSAKDGRAWFKRAVIDRCKLLGLEPKDDNEADALGILDYARALESPAYGAMSADLFRGAS